MNRSTIATIVIDRYHIMEHVKSCAPMQSVIITKKRGRIMEEMENMFVLVGGRSTSAYNALKS